MADTWVWQPVNPQPEQGRIFTLNIADYYGEIDQEAQTITFRIPEGGLIFGRLLGTVSILDADDEVVILSTGNNEFLLRQGMLGIFVSGDTISTPDGVVYTIHIYPYVEESRIFNLSINNFQGEINQDAQTITFRVPAQSLFFGNLLLGTITDLQSNSDTIILSANGSNQELSLGGMVIFSSGNTVSTPNGVCLMYTSL